VVDSDPPGLDDPRVIFRNKLFDTCFAEDNCYDQRRRSRLASLLTGDLTSDTIEWYTRQERPNQAQYAAELAKALLPEAIAIFPRHRWLDKLGSVYNCFILARCHGLLRRATPLWLGKRSAKKNDVDPWSPPEPSSGGAGGEDFEQMLNQPRGPGQGGDWTSFNEKIKGDAYNFSQSDAAQSLTIVSVALGPQVNLMRGLLKIAGTSWKASRGCLGLA
jgi:hypothetical protein